VAGIFGDQSGLVDEVFRIVSGRLPEWLVIENVQNMLVLGRGQAIRHVTAQLEALGMRWAYRVVDSRFAGVPQRRRRVIIVASRQHDPREVLFADDAGERPVSDYQRDAFGFYWTEGLRGLGWAQDAIPTLKGGSTIGIPSPPGIWVRRAAPGRKLVVPGADDAEALQGFARGWTSVCTGRRTGGVRLKLVGNAVTTGVAQWVGDRLSHPGVPLYEGVEVQPDDPWRSAAWGEAGKRWSIEDASEFPLHRPYQHLTSVVDVSAASPVSRRGAAGFLSRARRAKLRFDEAFLKDVAEHVEAMAEPPLTEAG
jgi:DNA (cytosine-5)-methyltransferase 1